MAAFTPAALKTFIDGIQSLSADVLAGNALLIADALNAKTAQTVNRLTLTTGELTTALDANEFAKLDVTERQTVTNTISLANRFGVMDVSTINLITPSFKSSPQTLQNLASLLTVPASPIELQFGSGVRVSVDDVSDAYKAQWEKQTALSEPQRLRVDLAELQTDLAQAEQELPDDQTIAKVIPIIEFKIAEIQKGIVAADAKAAQINGG